MTGLTGTQFECRRIVAGTVCVGFDGHTYTRGDIRACRPLWDYLMKNIATQRGDANALLKEN